MINVDADDRQDLDEAGPEDREDENVVVDQEDNVEVDDDAIGEREDRAEVAPKTVRQPQHWQEKPTPAI